MLDHKQMNPMNYPIPYHIKERLESTTLDSCTIGDCFLIRYLQSGETDSYKGTFLDGVFYQIVGEHFNGESNDWLVKDMKYPNRVLVKSKSVKVFKVDLVSLLGYNPYGR